MAYGYVERDNATTLIATEMSEHSLFCPDKLHRAE